MGPIGPPTSTQSDLRPPSAKPPSGSRRLVACPGSFAGPRPQRRLGLEDGSGRPRGPGRPMQKVGGVAPNLLQGSPGLPGPPRPPKSTISGPDFGRINNRPFPDRESAEIGVRPAVLCFSFGDVLLCVGRARAATVALTIRPVLRCPRTDVDSKWFWELPGGQ